MSSLALIIDSHTLTLIEKGKPAVQKVFNSEESFVEMVEKALKHRKTKVIKLFFTGQHLISETIITKRNSAEPFIINRKIIDQAINRSTDDFVLRHNKDNSHVLILAKPLTLLLNGYHIHEPSEQKVRNMRLTMFVSAIPKTFTKIPGELHSLPFHLAEQVHIKQKADSFILCSSGGETIDLSIKKEGDFFKTQSIKIGPNTEIEIKNILNDCFGGTTLPGDVYSVVPEEVFPIVSKIFAKDSYHSMCMTTQGFTLQALDVSSLIEV